MGVSHLSVHFHQHKNQFKIINIFERILTKVKLKRIAPILNSLREILKMRNLSSCLSIGNRNLVFELGARICQRSKSTASGCDTQENGGNYETNHKIKNSKSEKTVPKKDHSELSLTWHHHSLNFSSSLVCVCFGFALSLQPKDALHVVATISLSPTSSDAVPSFMLPSIF